MIHTTDDTAARNDNRWRLALWGTAALLLTVPEIAMAFPTEVHWTGADFVGMGPMVAAACGACGLTMRLSCNTTYRAAFGIAVLTGFLLVWVNLAVGLIGAETSPINLVFALVLLVAVFGAYAARGKAQGMARTLVATAVAQALGCVVALYAGDHRAVLASAVFVGMWLASALLFRRAARQQAVAWSRH